MGIPSMVVTRQGFTQLVINAYAGYGFPPEAPTIYEFPIEMFLKGSDLTPLRENIDKVVYGLTKWEAKNKSKGIFNPGTKITVQGKDYQDAVDKLNQTFLKNNWSDGLPITPATQERVDWILTGTDLPRSTPVGTGKILPRGGIATVEALAVQLAMAGGRPEYLPVLIAAVDALTVPEAMHSDWNATTVSNWPAVIVSGPMANQIRLNSSYGMLGPDPAHPAGGPIGRALRFVLQNLGGAVPGQGTMANFGQMRFTNSVFAEDLDGYPKSWKTLAEDLGFKREQNILTVFPVSSSDNVNQTRTDAKEGLEQEVKYLARVASTMQTTGAQLLGSKPDPKSRSGIVILCSVRAGMLDSFGYNKDKIEAFLLENSKISWEDLAKAGQTNEVGGVAGTSLSIGKPIIIVGGGAQSGHTHWMQSGKKNIPETKEIQLPKNWDQLIKAAETDLGPIPVDK